MWQLPPPAATWDVVRRRRRRLRSPTAARACTCAIVCCALTFWHTHTLETYTSSRTLAGYRYVNTTNITSTPYHPLTQSQHTTHALHTTRDDDIPPTLPVHSGTHTP